MGMEESVSEGVVGIGASVDRGVVSGKVWGMKTVVELCFPFVLCICECTLSTNKKTHVFEQLNSNNDKNDH